MLASNRMMLAITIALGLAAGGLGLTSMTIARPWTVAGPSMEPALASGDRVLVDLWTYRTRPPVPGEIVLFRGPTPESLPLIKRCVPLPADAPGVPRPGYWPPDRANRLPGVWLLGDNLPESFDSRRFGVVPRSRIIGRVVLRYRSGDGFDLSNSLSPLDRRRRDASR